MFVCIGVSVEMLKLIVGVKGDLVLIWGRKSLQGIGILGGVLLC